tara:strand:- start:9207 stop:9455 length:249 start_codon:yes stop_codon:yes gene_type:complete
MEQSRADGASREEMAAQMIDRKSGLSMIAAAAIMIGFGLAFYFMPRMMIAIGEISTIAAALFAAALVGAFFGVFWLRSHFQR